MRTELRRLARSAGILTSYRDLDGNRVDAKPEVIVAVLAALGFAVDDPDDASAAREELDHRAERRLAPPVAVIWDEGPHGVVLTLPSELASRRFEATLTNEAGERREWAPSGRTLLRRSPRRGPNAVIVRLPVPTLSYGYHRLDVHVDDTSHETLLIRAPSRAYRDDTRGRGWGLFAPLYALHSRANGGRPSFDCLAELARLTKSHGGRFVATLPFLASFPGESSPYSPLSRMFWNELYIDVPTLGSEPSPRLGSGRLDYDGLARAHEPSLRDAARDAWRSERDVMESFVESSPRVVDYARFRAALTRFGPDWRQWPATHRDGFLDEHDVATEDVQLHVFAQKRAHDQLDALAPTGHELFLDLPLGVHANGYDTWRERGSFAAGIDVGAPPDAAFPDGQNWSFPPLLPQRSRELHYRYLRRVYRHHMAHAGILRVDHVMGLHRQFWIPKGAGVEDGVYVRYPAAELYAMLHVESHRARCELVGENLGIVPDAVNERLARHGWRGLHVSQLTPDAPVPAEVVASLNTHDTPPFANSEGADAASLRRELTRLMSSDAELVSVNVEDLWLESGRQNVPGTTDATHPNWRQPLRYPMEELPSAIGSWLSSFSR